MDRDQEKLPKIKKSEVAKPKKVSAGLSEQEKQHVRNRLEEVIYREISHWTNLDVKPGDPLPIVRNGQQVGTLRGTILGYRPAWALLDAALLDDEMRKQKAIKTFNQVGKASKALIKALEGMKSVGWETSDTTPYHILAEALPPATATLPERIIREVGIGTSAEIAANALIKLADGLQEELAKPPGSRGTPKNEAAYAVARELALLFAKVTGERPKFAMTYSVASGRYTPSLRAVFDALEWRTTDLRGPAQRAVKSISDADLQHVENRPQWPFAARYSS